jgi:two-component system NtrC family sensor kinase
MDQTANKTVEGLEHWALPSRPRFRFYIPVVLLAVSIFPLALVGIGATVVFGRLLDQRALDLQEVLVRNHASNIETFLFERQRAMDSAARSHSFESLSTQAGLQRVFDSLSHSYDQTFVDMGVIDSDGTHVAYAGPYDLKDRNYAQAEWFRSVMPAGGYVSDVFMGFRQIPHCVIAVKRQEGEHAWVLRATVNSDKFQAIVRTEQLGSTGEAYLVNADGIYQLPPRHGRVLTKSPIGVPGVHPGVRSSKAQIDGETVIRTTTWLNNDRWMLVVERDEEEIRAPVHQAVMKGVLAVGLAAVLVIFATVDAIWLLTRQIDRANKERDDLSKELLRSAKLASLGELSTGLAHEINNPLAIILSEQTNIADLAAELPAAHPSRQDLLESVERCKRQVQRCGGITAKMLQFGRTGEPRNQPTDVKPKLEEIVDLMQKRAQLKNVRLVLSAEPDLPPLVLDPTELQQVIVNLINNAVYATEQGGEIAVAATRDGQKVRITVRDNGCGIPREHMSRVFQPFFTTKPVGQGTGLGLSVCYGIVRNWGGTMDIDSQEGAGTEVRIFLPLASENQLGGKAVPLPTGASS